MDEREKAQSRLDAIEIGRLAGRLEADSRREIDEEADTRVKRAMAYAAWDADGRPEGNAHLLEFGVAPSSATPSLERAPLVTSASKLGEEDNGKAPKRKVGGFQKKG